MTVEQATFSGGGGNLIGYYTHRASLACSQDLNLLMATMHAPIDRKPILHCGLHLCQRDVRSLFQPPVKEELHLPDELGFAPGEEMIRSRNLDLRRAA